MKTFKEGNWDNVEKCPMCNTSSEGEVVLVPIQGTIEGNLAEAIQVHTKCLQDRWIYNKEHNIIYAKG